MAGKRVTEILERMDAHYGTDFRCSLDHENAWQLLIATMLSAQCTDARVNIVTKDLFVKYPSVGICGSRPKGAGAGYPFHRLLP